MITFADHPDQWLLLRERPELAERAVEEVLRFNPAGTTLHRFAVTDIDFQGIRIPRDSYIGVQYALAQRDPLVFANPMRFDITAKRDAGRSSSAAGRTTASARRSPSPNSPSPSPCSPRGSTRRW